MKYTTNYQLKKPEAGDYYNIADFNDNADIIDAKLEKGMSAYSTVNQLLTRISNLEQRATTMETKGRIVLYLYGMTGTSVSITRSGYTSQVFTIGSSGYMQRDMPALGEWTISYTYNSVSYSTKINLEHLGVTVAALAPKLQDCSWAFIDKVGSLGLAESCWGVGDTKSLSVGSAAMQVRILDFNHDMLWSQGKGIRKTAPITFGLTQPLPTTAPAHSVSNTNIGWGERDIFTTYLPARKAELPSDLQSVIKKVGKVVMKVFSGTTNQDGWGATQGAELLQTDLFIFSERELFGESRGSNPYYEYERAYEYYARGNSFVMASDYWLRSNAYVVQDAFQRGVVLSPNGRLSSQLVTSSFGVVFGFCV